MRRISLLVVMALTLAACAYESSGTTTTTFAAPEDVPPALSPADVSLSDQRVEGSFFTVDRVSMPAAGWVVARVDESGAPGEVIGISELLAIGVIERVPVPFFVPISEDTVVHVTVHIDVDRDGRFTYEPPASFIDEIGLRENGEPATDRATLTILPPLSPSDVRVEDQVSDGASISGVSAELPAAGFVVVHADDDGDLGAVIGVSDLLQPGSVDGLEIVLDPPLALTQVVHVAVYIDRDTDGTFGPGEDADEIGVRDDGTLAIVSVEVTVPARAPAAVEAEDQTSDGDTVVITLVDLPFAGFVEILSDDDGEPGVRIGLSELIEAGVTEDLEIELSASLSASGTVWVRLWVDLDEDGVLSAGDAIALVEQGGDPAQTSFEVTVE